MKLILITIVSILVLISPVKAQKKGITYNVDISKVKLMMFNDSSNQFENYFIKALAKKMNVSIDSTYTQYGPDSNYYYFYIEIQKQGKIVIAHINLIDEPTYYPKDDIVALIINSKHDRTLFINRMKQSIIYIMNTYIYKR